MTDPDYPNDSPELAAFRKANQSFVDKWKVAGPMKAKIREERIRAADTVRSVEVLRGMRNHALQTAPPADRSGLVTLNRLLRSRPAVADGGCHER